jgi:hypothetical protein
VETFTHSGALSISTVPRAATALIVVFDPRGPRRAYIDYIRLNPEPCACYRRAGFEVNSASAGEAPRWVDSTSPECFKGMPLTNMLMLQSVIMDLARLSGFYRSRRLLTANIRYQRASTLCSRSKFFYVVDPNFFQRSIQFF